MMIFRSEDVSEGLIKHHGYIPQKSPASLNSRSVRQPCLRKTWLDMRIPSKLDLGSIRVKKRRDLELPMWLEECTALGWAVHTTHPKTGEPIIFKTPYVTVEMTALAKNATMGWFLLEAESVDDATFHRVTSHGVKSACPELWGHCMLGLGNAKLNQCGVFISSFSGDVYVEMIEFNTDEFLKLVDVCRTLTSQMTAPARVDWEDCGNCRHQQQCWDKEYIPKPSCFTCVYRKVNEPDVYCQRLKMNVTDDVWQEGCNEHLYVPQLINFAKKTGEIVLENGDNAITYGLQDGKTLINCGAKAPKKDLRFTSRELHLGGVLTIHNPLVQAIKEQFAGAKVISNE